MPLLLVAPYKLNAIVTAMLMRFNAAGVGTGTEEAVGAHIPQPYDVPHIAVSTAQAQSGTQSLHARGNGEALSTSTNASFTFPGDFTIEFFIRPNITMAASLLDCSGVVGVAWVSQGLTLNVNGSLTYSAYSNSSTGGANPATIVVEGLTTTPNMIITNQWNHIAIVRQGTSYSVYANGVRGATATRNLAPYAPIYPTVFCDRAHNSINKFGVAQGFDGHLDNVRVTKGVARYTGTSYAVPATPFATSVAAGDPSWANVTTLLDMESLNTNRVPVDLSGQSTYQLIYIGTQTMATFNTNDQYGGASNSLKLDTSGMIANQNVKFAPGTSDFTVEFWTKSTTVTAKYKSLVSTRRHVVDTAAGFAVGINDRALYVYADKFLIQGGAITPGAWDHIALVRYNGVMTLYLNGNAVGSYSTSVYNFTEDVWGIGCNTDGSENWIGSNTTALLSDLRISKIARYKQNFVRPTSRLPVD